MQSPDTCKYRRRRRRRRRKRRSRRSRRGRRRKTKRRIRRRRRRRKRRRRRRRRRKRRRRRARRKSFQSCSTNIKHFLYNTMQITKAFIEHLRALHDSMGVQGRNTLLFVDNYATHMQDTSLLSNIKVVYYPPDCTTALQPLHLGIIKCFQQLYRKHLLQKACACGLEERMMN
jgi:hypothetical protein